MPRWAPTMAAASSVVGVEERGGNVQVLRLRECRLSRQSSQIEICTELKDVVESCHRGALLACRESSSRSSSALCCLHQLLLQLESKSSESKAKSSMPVRKTGRQVREALLNLPPYPPSVRVLLRVRSCFQSLLIQSEMSSPSA